jgi:hypothetical protein
MEFPERGFALGTLIMAFGRLNARRISTSPSAEARSIPSRNNSLRAVSLSCWRADMEIGRFLKPYATNPV